MVRGMEGGSTLLLFDDGNPCWTEDLVRLAGEDPHALSELRSAGRLAEEGGAYFLTTEGRAAFLREAAECFLAVSPGEISGSCRKSLFRTRLRLLLDKKHIQRWGLKKFVPEVRVPIPFLENDALFSEKGGIKWRWPASRAVARLRSDWPVVGIAARKEPPPTADAVAEWFKRAGEKLDVFETDLLYLSRYDFQAYAAFAPLPGDSWGLLNADRFFCVEAPEPQEGSRREYLRVIGKFQLCLEVLRRMVLPGYMDLDSLDQDGINWLVFLFEEEAEAEKCVSLLAPFGLDLIRRSMPMDVWTLSFEALEHFSEKAETIHDLLPVIGKAVVRTP